MDDIKKEILTLRKKLKRINSNLSDILAKCVCPIEERGTKYTHFDNEYAVGVCAQDFCEICGKHHGQERWI